MLIKRWRMETILIIGLGGFIGANLRYFVNLWVVERFGAGFPWGTLLINFTGSCLLAVFLAFAANRLNLDPRWRLLIATGFFGAYTTFSTWMVEAQRLGEDGAFRAMWLYLLGSMTAGLAVTGAGWLLGGGLG